MSDLGTARGRVVIDPSGAVAGFGTAAAASEDFHKKTVSGSKQLHAAGLAMAGAGAAIAGGLGLAIKTAADFEKQIDAIGAVSGASEKQLESIRQKALQLGADTSFSAKEAAGGLEELVKAGVPLQDVMSGAAEATVHLAEAGGVELAEAASIASAALNTFNLEGKDMEHVADLIAGAANSSAIDVHEFGESLKQSGAAADLVGLSFDDLSLAITAMGNAGIKGSDAGTSLKTFLLNLQPVTDRQKEAMRELGVITEEGGNKFFDAAGNVKSLAEISEILKTGTADLTAEEKTMALEMAFGTDAIRAAAIITEEGAAGFGELATQMGKVSAEDVAEKRMDNLAGSIEKLKGSLETVAIAIGTPFLDGLRTFADALADIANSFLELSPATQEWVGRGLALAAIILTLLGGIALLVGWLTSAGAAVTALGTVLGILFSWVGVIVLAVAALAAGLIYLWNTNEGFRESVRAVWEWIATNVPPFIEKVITGIEAMVAAFQEGDVTSDGFVGTMERIGVVARQVVEWITGTLVPGIIAFVEGLVDAGVAVYNFAHDVEDGVGAMVGWLQEHVFPIFVELGALFAAAAERIIQVIEFLQPLWSAMWNIIVNTVRTVLEVVTVVIRTFVDNAITIWNLLGDNLIDAVVIAFNFIKGWIESVLQIIRGIIQVVTGIITGDWGKAWDGIKNIVGGVWGIIQTTVQFGMDAIMFIIRTVLDTIHAIWSVGWNTIHAVVDIVWQLIQNTVFTAINACLGIIESVLNIISAIWSTAWGFMRDIVTEIVGFIVGYIQGQMEFLIGLFSGAINWLWQAGSDIITGLFNGIKAIWETVASWAAGFPQTIKDWFWNAWTWLVDAGGWIISGLKQGILNALETIGDFLEGIKNTIVNGFKAVFNISSPSRVMFEIGYQIIRGLLLGMFSNAGQIKDFIKNIGLTIADLAQIIGESEIFNILVGPGFGILKELFGDIWSSFFGGDPGDFGAVQDMAIAARGLVGFARAANAFFKGLFPWMTIGGWRAQGSVPGSDHPKGKALDLMTTSGAIAAQIIAIFRGMPGAKYWIWNRQISTAASGWAVRPYSGPSPHTDHVHLSFYRTGAWEIFKDQLAFLHQGEMVLPRSVADVARSLSRTALARTTGGGPMTFMVNVGPGAVVIGIPPGATPREAAALGRAASKSFLDTISQRRVLAEARIR